MIFLMLKNKNVKTITLLALFTIIATACNNDAKDSVEKADSANEVKQDSTAVNPRAIQTDEESTTFLVKAANNVMAEMEMGELARQKAVTQEVKDFGAKMKTENSIYNDIISGLAKDRHVTLPEAMGDIQQKDRDALSRKTGTDFDKAYINAMTRAHTETIQLFGQAADRSNDAELKTFINNTLPKLKNHLDAAKMIQQKIK